MPTRLTLSDYDAALLACREVLEAEGTLIYPTDTLYGLGCNALSEKAVEKIYQIKKRDGRRPLSMIVSDFPMLLEYCEITGEQEKILHTLLPGPYTFILKLRKKLPVSEQLNVGIRAPEHQFIRQVARECGFPIVSTSANLSGQKDAAEVAELDGKVAGSVDLVIDGGRCQYAQGSTVIDLLEMKVLRKGATRPEDKFEFAQGDG